ncbi:hypothetical protein [Paraburkholderia caribensis]|uniref:hypothetical protein n=1 Tax=Paraburkholderia caribensis TaxID=75105 RepID=UPI001313E6BC|nr:hypothetical protein [Paraburkholderia caribensis]
MSIDKDRESNAKGSTPFANPLAAIPYRSVFSSGAARQWIEWSWSSVVNFLVW